MVELSIKIPDETINAVRALLAEREGDDEDIERFIQKAVQYRLFTETVQSIKAQNAQYDQQEIMDTVDEAVKWARENRS